MYRDYDHNPMDGRAYRPVLDAAFFRGFILGMMLTIPIWTVVVVFLQMWLT